MIAPMTRRANNDLSLIWMGRTFAALAPAIRALPEMIVLSPELLLEISRTADVLQKLARCLQAANGGAVV